jgi:hypothetical protein
MATNNIINNDNPNLLFAFTNNASPVANATGDGTWNIALWDTAWKGTIITSNGWTVTTAGYYLIGWNVNLTGLTSSHVLGVTGLHLSGSGWGTEVYTNPYSLSTGGSAVLSNTCICQMAVGDQIWINVAVSGGSLVVNIANSTAETVFYGLLIA